LRISLHQACEFLKKGHVVGIPTETVYGLAACLDQSQAIAEIFTLKGRPANNPLIVHLATAEEIKDYAVSIPESFFALADAFWPGPLTLVLPAIPEKIPSIVRAELPTAAFRVPSHSLARQLLQQTGPLVMPSANLSGRPSSTCAEHVEEDFGDGFPVLDGGECLKGLESTILFWQDEKWMIIRLGAIAPEAFGLILGYDPEISLGEGNAQPICPGQMYRHYAPRARLFLIQKFSLAIKGLVIGFDDRNYSSASRFISLGNSSDPETASQRLYAILRELDQEGIDQAWVDIDLPDEGLWLTFKERLFKASSSLT